MNKIFSLLLIFPMLVFGQTSDLKIKSGPMLGYAELTECLVWVQLTHPTQNVYLEYWEKKKENHLKTKSFNATEENSNVLNFLISNLKPGTTYQYKLKWNEDEIPIQTNSTFTTQSLWQYRSNPPEFSFALGSCSYINETEVDRPGKPYGGDYQIFESIAQKSPNLMLWLGDNIYLREVDFFSKKGIHHRYAHMRSLPELQNLLSACNHYAIWDDHDFGPNDADFSFTHKDWTLEAFKLFWGNNGYGINGKPGITSFFRYNDLDFFLLDNRYYRTPQWNGKKREILGEEQIEWLIAGLKYSRAPFKFVAVGGQVLNTAKVYENHSKFPEEQQYLLDRIAEEKIEGVIFLTGDRHHTELSKKEHNGVVIYDFTVSPLTSGPSTVANNEENKNRVEGTYVAKRNFGLIEVKGPRKNRTLSLNILDSDGNLIWEKEIKSVQ